MSGSGVFAAHARRLREVIKSRLASLPAMRG